MPSTAISFVLPTPGGARTAFLVTALQAQNTTSLAVKAIDHVDPYPRIEALQGSFDEDFITAQQRRKHSIPAWGKAVNNAMEMPMITSKDKLHIHAGSASIWFLTSYPLLFIAWCQEFFFDDWSLFERASPFVLPLAFCSLIMASTAFPMLPTSKRFSNYSGQMVHSMVSAAVLSTLATSFCYSNGASMVLGDIGGSVIPAMQQLTAFVGFIMLVWYAVMEGRPWNLIPIMKELKFDSLEPTFLPLAGFCKLSLRLPLESRAPAFSQRHHHWNSRLQYKWLYPWQLHQH